MAGASLWVRVVEPAELGLGQAVCLLLAAGSAELWLLLAGPVPQLNCSSTHWTVTRTWSHKNPQNIVLYTDSCHNGLTREDLVLVAQ